MSVGAALVTVSAEVVVRVGVRVRIRVDVGDTPGTAGATDRGKSMLVDNSVAVGTTSTSSPPDQTSVGITSTVFDMGITDVMLREMADVWDRLSVCVIGAVSPMMMVGVGLVVDAGLGVTVAVEVKVGAWLGVGVTVAVGVCVAVAVDVDVGLVVGVGVVVTVAVGTGVDV